MSTSLACGLWLAGALIGATGAGAGRAADGPGVVMVEAIAEARHDLDLGFTVQGRVSRVLVEAGERVEAGALLIELEDDEGAATVALFEVRASSGLDVEAAEAELKLAENELGRLEDAMSRAGAAPFEVERARLEVTRARLSRELAEQRREEARAQLAQAKARHERYSMRAPLAGVIETVLVEPGELVDEVRPVLRLVRADPLRIDAATPVGIAAGLRVGGSALVRFKEGGRQVRGTIVQIGAVADPGSETRLVRIEAANPEGEPAGSHVMVEFGAAEAAAAGGDAGRR
ncbi:MAG: efflux RND transporter periplasmic adaptor subunit [Planctomycetota bacterium]|nr:efflux RND transporter periplasmic adaptor subunit [Planctomycetota bacterium]